MTGIVLNRPKEGGGELTGGASRAARLALKALLVAVVCHLSIQVGHVFKFPPHHISALWPASAVLVSILVASPIRHWWLYLIAGYSTFAIDVARYGFLVSDVLYNVADIIKVLIAAFGVRWFADGVRAFDSLRGLVRYIAFAVVLGPVTSAFVAALAGVGESYWFYWRAWCLSEALTFLTLGPAILTWLAAARHASGNVSPARLLEAGLLACGLLAISVLVFRGPAADEGSIPVLVYLPLPFLLWAAVRFGPVGVSTALLAIAFLAISGVAQGRGPFATGAPADNVLPLQLFLITLSLPLMFLAALIAERRERTNVLRESEARFRSLADTAPVLVWLSDTDRRCTLFNKGWLDFTGRTLEQELGDGWAEGIHPDDVARCLATYGGAFDARRPFTMEYRLRRHDGEYRWIVDKGVPRVAPDGTFLGYIGCGDDVTDRKLAEERASQVLEAAPNAMMVVNRAGRITLVNAAVEAVFGYTRVELVGQAVEMLVPERFRATHAGDRGRYLAAPTVRAMGAGRELSGRRKDGTEVPIEVGLTPLRTSEGLFALASIVDITARKQAEFAAQEHRAELAHLARVSTMGELAASLAHELAQPLTAILSNVQTARRVLDTDPADVREMREILGEVVEDGTRAGAVIQRLRALARKEQPVFKPLDLDGVLRDVVRLVHSDAVLRQSRVAVEIDPGLPPVRGDRIELQQVALNLLMNAFDAMRDCPTDERRVVLRARLDGPRIVRVSASDRGTGLSAGNLERIFQPFYTTKREGLGMGLSICRAIIDAHGGRLWAENNPDRGATFYFTVPVARAEETAKPA